MKNVYAYKCKKCGHEQDEMRHKEDRNKTGECTECGGPTFRKYKAVTVTYAWSGLTMPPPP